MANYLFLRGNRNKHFFSDVASELEEKGHKCYQLKFELGELLITSKIESIFVPRHVSDHAYPVSDHELLSMNIYNITYKKEMKNTQVSKKELHMYKRYMCFMDQFIAANEIDVICMFNGYHWIDQVAAYIARKRNIKTMYFEQGFFRPFTLTCDPNGINAAASIPRQKDFYQTLSWDQHRFKNYLMVPQNAELLHVKGENLMQVAFVKAVSMLGSIFKINPKLYAHITWLEAIKYFLFKHAFKFKRKDDVPLPEEFIFVPFQVARDTQIFYNSSIKSMERLADLVYTNVEKINKRQNRNIHIVFKEHPEDMPRNSYKDLKKRYEKKSNVMFLQKRNVEELIKKSTAVITINSTVGIEALAQYKQVITLGEAFYNIDGIVLQCENTEKLDEVIERALSQTIDKTLIAKFLYYLRFHYQIEGNLISPNPTTAEKVADHLDSIVHKLQVRSEYDASCGSYTSEI